jgi:hypothetical protein
MQMESFVGGAILIEAGFLSFLLALWITWMGLNGVFRLLPATSRKASSIRFVSNQRASSRSRHAA